MSRNDQLLAEIRELVAPWLDELRRTITSNQSVNERGAHRKSCPADAAPRGVAATLVANTVKGYSFRETTGAAPAVIVLRDGPDATGEIVATITLAAGADQTQWFADRGVALINGLYVDRVTGTTEGAVYLGAGGTT